MTTRLLQPYKQIFHHWKHGLKTLVQKWLTQNFGIKQKIESETDQSKYTKNELVQPIRIENSVNKHNDAIWNIYSHYVNKWHIIRQTIYIKWICICKNTIYLVSNINLLLNSILTSIRRICKRLQHKHKTDIESYKTKLH